MKEPFRARYGIIFDDGEDYHVIIALFVEEDECKQAFEAINDGNYYLAKLGNFPEIIVEFEGVIS
jgi:hypothetical protein